jgi:PEP-CTERM putative exosortase interaction domain
MKYSKYLAIAMLVCLGTLSLQQAARADLSVGDIVSQFNGLNAGRGYMFTYTNVSNEGQMKAVGSSIPPRTAYTSSTSAANYFNSYCVEEGTTITSGGQYSAQLNYTGNSTQNSTGNALTLGAAYLYQQYAAGTLTGFNYADRAASATALQEAMHILTTQPYAAWGSNTFLNQLLAQNSQTHWLQTYDPGKRYSEIGDFSVFVMQVKNTLGGGDFQDFVYVAPASLPPSVDTPEPATMLLWLTGGLSALGFGYVKKRRKLTSLA